jgi:hypothetical protein
MIASLFPMKRVVDQILGSVAGRKPVWMSEPDDFISAVAQRAPQEFDRAFGRWRELYNAARTQLMEANARSEITGLSGADRRRITAAQMQASDQITILEQGKATNGSDLYSYRYLATEGFLPGYNFRGCRCMPSSLEMEKRAPSSSALAFWPFRSSGHAA